MKLKFILNSLIFYNLVLSTVSYEFTEITCLNKNVQQSPINIFLSSTIYSESNNFRLLTNDFKPITPTDNWTFFKKENAIGVAPATPEGNFGSILLVKSWSIYNFILKKVIFRIGDEHLIDNRKNDVEMQLIFVLNANYYSPGKRKFLDTNNLIISIPFKEASNNEVGSKLFDFMNLEKYAQNPNQNIGMKRDIKLWNIIVHQPSFMYKGTLTFPDCDDTLWIVNTNYHIISTSDKNNLISATRNFYKNSQNNKRDLQNILSNTVIYRNFESLNEKIHNPNKLSYNKSNICNISFVLLVLIFIFLFLF
jgi:carbonic anhydrase